MSGPRIAIDALGPVVGGGLAWLRGLVPALAEQWPEATFDVLVRAGLSEPFPPSPRVRLVRIPTPPGAARMAVEWTAVPTWAAAAKPLSLLAGADAGPVACPCPMVQVVQNAKIYRERGLRYRLLRRAAIATARASRASVFVSQALRVVAEPVLRPTKSVVIPHGVSVPPPGPPPPRPVPWPYVLVVATPYEHKDLPTALAAVLSLRRRGRPERLVLVGGGGDPRIVPGLRAQAASDPDAFVAVGIAGGDALEAWYAHASALLCPSREESSGMPVAEAIARGLPVVASDIAALVETAAGQARHHTVGDADGAARRLLESLEHVGDVSARLESGRAWARSRTWREAARRYREVLDVRA